MRAAAAEWEISFRQMTNSCTRCSRPVAFVGLFELHSPEEQSDAHWTQPGEPGARSRLLQRANAYQSAYAVRLERRHEFVEPALGVCDGVDAGHLRLSVTGRCAPARRRSPPPVRARLCADRGARDRPPRAR